jgi:hypothetical protein
MRPHHERAVGALADHFAALEGHLAVIIGGTVAKGVAGEFADIDCMLVVSEDLYREHEARGQLTYFSTAFCDYPGGYVDGKIIDMAYLRAATERGNEPTRAAFIGAFTAYCADPEIDKLITKIPVYPVAKQADKMRAFSAQFETAYWYLGEGAKRGDSYLVTHATSDLVLYGSRLILAHNQILYPYHKLLMAALESAPEKPDGLMALIRAALAEPGVESARPFYDAIRAFRQWNDPPEPWNERFMRDTEWAWLNGTPYIGDI